MFNNTGDIAVQTWIVSQEKYEPLCGFHIKGELEDGRYFSIPYDLYGVFWNTKATSP